jgi:exodeoxyribonuclease X
MGETVTIARVIDFETTGTPESDGAEIIEAGRIDVDLEQRRVLTETAWSSLCRPRSLIPPETKAVHHIQEDDVADAPAWRDLIDEFMEGCAPTDYLVAHKADFEKHFFDGDGRPWIDTYKVARIIWPDAPGHSNQCLRYWLALDFNPKLAHPPHRALPDAFVTAHIFAKMLEIETLERMVAISRYPALIKTMNFGKHKGMTFEAAPMDYLEWLRDKSDMGEDVKFSARYWIQKRTRKEAA